MPDEYRTLISAYTVGRISLEELRGVCKWGSATAGVREDLAYARRQNIQFCEGFLSGSLEFTRLDAEAFAKLSDGDLGRELHKCSSTSVATLRMQLLRGAEGSLKQPASGEVLGRLIGCVR